MKSFLILLWFFLLRFLSVILVKTWFVPDEYWQSLEVSHRFVFGYGHLTWEWQKGIRSYIYPLIISGIYKLLFLLEKDSVEILVMAPRIFQAILSAYSDYRYYIWTGKKKWAVFLISLSYMWFYTGSRTLVNTFETSLTVIALSFFPWNSDSSGFLWIVSFCCFVRPTSCLTWLPLCIYHIKTSKLSFLQVLFKRYAPICGTVFIICATIDTMFHGSFILTPFEFFKFNFIKDFGDFYGTHSWYWYFCNGLPTLLGLESVPFVLATIETIRNPSVFPIRSCILTSIFVTIFILSLKAHKEIRFILILLPLCLYLSSDFLTRWSRKASRFAIFLIAIVFLISNIIPGWYVSTEHQKGTIDVMPHLAKIAREYKGNNEQKAYIFFLMPCHSTPYYSHIHVNITMRFLSCEPNFENKAEYIDETELFYQNPTKYLKSHLPVYPINALPSHLVMFDTLSAKISTFLEQYEQILNIPHSKYLVGNVGHFVLVYQRKKDIQRESSHLDDSQKTF